MSEIKYGCHVELGQGEQPDDCVLNYGAPDDCVFGRTPSGRIRKAPHTCKYWKPITPPQEPTPSTTGEGA